MFIVVETECETCGAINSHLTADCATPYCAVHDLFDCPLYHETVLYESPSGALRFVTVDREAAVRA